MTGNSWQAEFVVASKNLQAAFVEFQRLRRLAPKGVTIMLHTDKTQYCTYQRGNTDHAIGSNSECLKIDARENIERVVFP